MKVSASYIVNLIVRERWWCSGEHHAFQAVDLGSIPGRRKEVFCDLDSIQEDLDSIQGDLVTPAIDVISPRFVAQPFSTLLLKNCQHFAAYFLCLQVRASVILDIHQLIGSAYGEMSTSKSIVSCSKDTCKVTWTYFVRLVVLAVSLKL